MKIVSFCSGGGGSDRHSARRARLYGRWFVGSERMEEKSELQRRLDEWRENAKHMYEQLDTVSLEWPTLSAQWLRDDRDGKRALVGTFTLGQEPEFVYEVEVDTDKQDPAEHQIVRWAVPPQPNSSADSHEAQRLRQSPVDPDLFACLAADGGDVLVYHRSAPNKPPTRLSAHTAAGFGLAWSPRDVALVSGAEDGRVVLWVPSAPGGPLEKRAELDTNSSVNEVSWDHENDIVVALENGHVLVLDTQLKVVQDLACQSEAVNSASLSPFAPHLLVTGGADGRWRLFDRRRDPATDPSDPASGALHENGAHEGAINAVRWSPHVDGVLATAAMDGVVYLWDIRKIGQDQPHEDVLDGAAELLFKHNGHLRGDQVQEIDWHPKIPLLLLSCDDRNALMSWKPKPEVIEAPRAPPMPSFLI